MAGLLGIQNMNADDMTRKLEDMLPTIQQINEQFKDPVCIWSTYDNICFQFLVKLEIKHILMAVFK